MGIEPTRLHGNILKLKQKLSNGKFLGDYLVPI